MRKVLVVLMVLAFAVSSFGAVDTVTKENAQAGYPAALKELSISTVDYFPALITKLGNVVAIEYVGTYLGYIVLNTDIGTIGISSAPAQGVYVPGVSPSLANGLLGLSYGTELEGMAIGATLRYGAYSEGEKTKSPAPDYDKVSYEEDSGYNTLGLNLGVSLAGDMPIDLGLGVSMLNEYYNETDYDNTSGDKNYDYNEAANILGLALNARVGLDSWIIGAMVNFATGDDKWTYKEEASYGTDDMIATTSNTSLMLGLGASYKIEATDSLTVLLGTGLAAMMNQEASYLFEDKTANTKIVGATKDSWTDIVVPFNVAVEGKINETWSVNTGAGISVLALSSRSNKTNVDALFEKEDFKETDTESSFTRDSGLSYAIGLRGKFGDVTFDWNINPNILISGPNFISGINTGFSSNVAAQYAW
ncbi:MAG TPA: hypothetical protein ENN43_06320 [bacterium]|nr:hypothetical protein [bacterium]